MRRKTTPRCSLSTNSGHSFLNPFWLWKKRTWGPTSKAAAASSRPACSFCCRIWSLHASSTYLHAPPFWPVGVPFTFGDQHGFNLLTSEHRTFAQRFGKGKAVNDLAWHSDDGMLEYAGRLTDKFQTMGEAFGLGSKLQYSRHSQVLLPS